MPWGAISPSPQSTNSSTNSATDTTMRTVNALSVRFDWPLSLIRKNSAEPMLATIPMNMAMMRIFDSMRAPTAAGRASILDAPGR